MKSFFCRIVVSFFCSIVSSFLIALIASIFIVEPELVVNKLSVAYHVPAGSTMMMASRYYSKSWGEAILMYAIGSLGGILGWLIFRGFYMYIVNFYCYC